MALGYWYARSVNVRRAVGCPINTCLSLRDLARVEARKHGPKSRPRREGFWDTQVVSCSKNSAMTSIGQSATRFVPLST